MRSRCRPCPDGDKSRIACDRFFKFYDLTLAPVLRGITDNFIKCQIGDLLFFDNIKGQIDVAAGNIRYLRAKSP